MGSFVKGYSVYNRGTTTWGEYMIRLRVKEEAEARGYNAEQLARASGLGITTIRRLWKKPYEGAHIHTLEVIARTLKVPVSALYEEEESNDA